MKIGVGLIAAAVVCGMSAAAFFSLIGLGDGFAAPTLICSAWPVRESWQSRNSPEQRPF